MLVDGLHKVWPNQFGPMAELASVLRIAAAFNPPSGRRNRSRLIVTRAFDAKDHSLDKHGFCADLRVRVQQGQQFGLGCQTADSNQGDLGAARVMSPSISSNRMSTSA
jgi:hypothetical protein